MLRRLTAPAVLALALCVLPTDVGAQDDVGRQVRLLVADGKFSEADDLLGKAPEEVRNDAELRWALATAAGKWAKRRKGMERISGLEASRDHYAAVMKQQPDNADAALGAVDAALELVELWKEAKNGLKADENTDWAIGAGEEAFGGGVQSPDLKAGVAELYALRATRVATVEQVDQLSNDYRRAAELYASVAPGHKNESEWFGEAAYCRMNEAKFINEKIPLKEEKRDEEGIKAAIDFATKACAAKGAKTDAYTVQLLTLRLATQWGVKGPFPDPFMEEYPREVEGLKLLLPRAKGWQKTPYKGYDLLLNRKFEGETKAVQLMIRRLPWDDSRFGGVSWADIDTVVERKHESEIENFDPVTLEVEPVNLAGKKENEVWHYRIAGIRTSDGKQVQLAEWFWRDPKKSVSVTYNLKILDFSAPWGIEDPDIVKFVESACGQGLTPKQKPKKGKRKKKKKKKKR